MIRSYRILFFLYSFSLSVNLKQFPVLPLLLSLGRPDAVRLLREIPAPAPGAPCVHRQRAAKGVRHREAAGRGWACPRLRDVRGPPSPAQGPADQSAGGAEQHYYTHAARPLLQLVGVCEETTRRWEEVGRSRRREGSWSRSLFCRTIIYDSQLLLQGISVMHPRSSSRKKSAFMWAGGFVE